MTSIQLYTKSNCPYCVSAKRLLQERSFQFTEINLDGKQTELIELKERTQWRTVPQIFVGDKFIGGYTELAELDRTGELAQLLKGN